MKVKLSVVIITFNEEKNIGRCLESVKNIADEIVVVDDHSTDRTCEIAKGYNARIIQNTFVNYGQQRRFALSKCTFDWVFSIDADEELDETLQTSIHSFLRKNPEAAGLVRRKNFFCGKPIRFGAWNPDLKLRLWNKRFGNYSNAHVHEKIVVQESIPRILMEGRMNHFTVNSTEEHLATTRKYAEMYAQENYLKGRKVLRISIVPRAVFEFIRQYLLKLGILDGRDGLTLARIGAYSTYLKYTNLYLKNRKSRKEV